MSLPDHYDVCVVGDGLVGWSAAKYAVYMDQTVCLVGAGKLNGRAKVKPGYYLGDQELVRKMGPRGFWSTAATRSIDRFESIERASGVHFHHPVGVLVIADEGSPYLKDIRNQAKDLGLSKQLVNIPGNKMRGKYPNLNPILGMEALLEDGNGAGVFGAEEFSEAQKKLFVSRGGVFIEDNVTGVKQLFERYEVQTENHGSITADKVFLCVGPHLYHRRLLPSNTKLDVMFVGKTAISFPMPRDRPDVAEELRKMPVVEFVSDKNYNAGIKGDDALSFCLMPPKLLQDGTESHEMWYSRQLKTMALRDPNEISKWYSTQNEATALSLFADVKKFVNGIPATEPNVSVQNTVNVYTAGDLPYIGVVDDNQLYAFAGDCGQSAAGSDEIGRLLALVAIEDMWDMPEEIPREWFSVRKRFDPKSRV